MVLATSASDGERPSRTALVESPISASTPASPSSRSRRSSVGTPMIGVGSIFQSPVCSTVPAEVWIASACDSGIECATGMNSTLNGPRSMRPPDGTTVTGIFGGLRSEAHLASNRAALNLRRVDRAFQLRPQIDDGAEMILMGVRQHEADQILALLLQEADVRHDQVDARQMFLVAERHAEIDREPAALMAIAEAVDRQVHADLADAAERRKGQFIGPRHQAAPADAAAPK